MNTEENPYEVLGIAHGPTTSEAEIKRAYRKLALKKHPDKNPDNPNAAAEFAQLQKSYDILCDEDARFALDEWLRIQSFKKRENAARGEKRRKLAEELEKKERFSEKVNEETIAKVKLQQQIERLRQEAIDREQTAFVKRRVDAMKLQRQEKAEKSIIIEISWDDSRALTLESVKSTFSTFGTVEQISRFNNDRKDHCALVTIKTPLTIEKIMESSLVKSFGMECRECTEEQAREIESARQGEPKPSHANGMRQRGRIFPAAKSSGSFTLKQRPSRTTKLEDEVMGKMKSFK